MRVQGNKTYRQDNGLGVQAAVTGVGLTFLLKVLVDIRYIEVKVDTSGNNHNDDYYNNDHDGDNDHHDHDQYGKWDTLNITPRVYDLLKLKNGVDTLIANSYALAGKITKIRINPKLKKLALFNK